MTEGVETDTFDFYLKFAKPLVLNLPDPNERVLAAAWVKKLRDESTGNESIRKDYLKLLLFSLNRKKLTGPFSENPKNETLKDLQRPNEILELAKDIVLKEERDRNRRIKTGLAGGDFPPYSTECSADLLEYAAAQDIPKFGVHAYYALSFEPITKWDNAEKGILPKGIFLEGLQKSVANVSSVPVIATKSETPKKTPKATPKKLTPLKSPKLPEAVGAETGISPTKDTILSPFGSRPPVEQRSPVTWGSNLLEVLETSDVGDEAVKTPRFSKSFDDSTLPSLPYLTPTRPGDTSYFEAPSLPYRTPRAEDYDSFEAAEAALRSPKSAQPLPVRPYRTPKAEDYDSFEAAEAAVVSPKSGYPSPLDEPDDAFDFDISADTDDFLLDEMNISLADSPLRSPQGLSDAQYALLLSPRKTPATPQAAAAAQYASLFSPEAAAAIPARQVTPKSLAEAQYASLLSPEEAKATPSRQPSPKSVADAQYASLFSPEEILSSTVAPTARQLTPKSIAEAQYASLFSPEAAAPRQPSPVARPPTPKSLAEAQYASLLSPEGAVATTPRQLSPAAVADAQYASLYSPESTLVVPTRQQSPRSLAEAQYATLMSPQKPRSPQALARAQYESLLRSPERQMSPPRPQDPQSLADAQYAALLSPGQAAGPSQVSIPSSRSQEARTIIAEANASLQQITTSGETSPDDYYEEYYRHKRRDMPPTPPVFSKNIRIREGPGRDTVYEPEQFDVSAGETWHPGTGFAFEREPAQTTPVKPDRSQFQKKPQRLEQVFPKVRTDAWSEVFFEAQVPEMVDYDEDDVKMDVSEVPKEDLDLRLKKLLSDIRDASEDSPAAAGVAATTPRPTPSPARIHPYGTDFPLFEIDMPEYFSPVTSPATRAKEQYAELMGSPKQATPVRPPSPPKPKTPSPARDPNMDDFDLPYLVFEKPKTPEQPAPTPVEKSPVKKADTPKKEESPKRLAARATPPKNMTELQAVVDAQYAALYDTLVADEPKSPVAGPSSEATKARSPSMSPKTAPAPSAEDYPPTIMFDWETPPKLKIEKPKPPTPPSPLLVGQTASPVGMLLGEAPPEDFQLLDTTPPTPPAPMAYEEYIEEYEPYLRPDEDFDIEEDVTTLGPLLEAHEYEPYEARTSVRVQVGRRAKKIPISSRKAVDMELISEEPEFTYLPPIETATPPTYRPRMSPKSASPVRTEHRPPVETRMSPAPHPVDEAAQAAAVTRDIISDAKQHFVSGFEDENLQGMLHRVLDLVEDVEGEESIVDVEGLQREVADLPKGSPKQFLDIATPPREFSDFDEIEQAFGPTPPRPPPRSPPTPPPPIPEFGFQGEISDFMPEYRPYLLPFQREGYVRPEVDVGKSPKKLTPPRKNVFGEIDYEIPKRKLFPFLESSEYDAGGSPVHLVGDDDDTNLAQALVMEEPIVSPRPKIRTPGRSPVKESPPGLPVRPTRLSPESPPTPDLIDFIVSTAFREEEPYRSDGTIIRQGESNLVRLPRHAGKSAVPALRDVREVPDFYDDDDLMFLEEVDLAHELYPWARHPKQMTVRTGSKAVRLQRRARRPGLETVTEELDHIPTPTRIPAGTKVRRRRRLDFDIENPDGSPEPRKIALPPNRPFQLGQPLPPTPPREGRRRRYVQYTSPTPVVYPEDLMGAEADVPYYNRETLLDIDDIPPGMPTPMRHPIEIEGWQTPPHLKTPPPPTPVPPRFTDDFINLMSYEKPPEEYLILPHIPDEPEFEEIDFPLSTAFPFFMEHERSPTVSPGEARGVSPKVFGRAEPRTRVPRQPSPTMKKTVKTVVHGPTGSETTTTITETSPRFPTPPPPVAPRAMTPSPRTVQMGQDVLQTADEQYNALLNITPRLPTPSPPSAGRRRRSPSPAITNAAALVEHAAADQYASLFADTPSPPTWTMTPSPGAFRAAAAVESTAADQYAALFDETPPTPEIMTPSPGAVHAAAAVQSTAADQYASLFDDTPPAATRRMTPSPAVARAAAAVRSTAADQYAALFEETPRRRTPSPGVAHAAKDIAAADQFAALFSDMPSMLERTQSPESSWELEASITSLDFEDAPITETPKRSAKTTRTVTTTTTPKSQVQTTVVEKTVSPTTPRDYEVMTKPSPYWTGGTPAATPPRAIRRQQRPPSPPPRIQQPSVWDIGAADNLGEEIEPLDLMPIGSPVSPHSTRSYMQEFMSDVRRAGSKMVRKPIILHGYGEKKPYKLPRRYFGSAHLDVPFEQPEPEDEYVYWPGPYDPKSADISRFQPKHLKYTQIENVETYEPTQFSPARMPDPNLPLIERAAQLVGDVPEPEDLEMPVFSPHVPHVFQTPPPPSPRFPRLPQYVEQLEEMEFPEDDILMSPVTPPGIPAEMRRRTPGTPLGTPPWQIPAELRRRTPGTPFSTPPFRADRFEGIGLGEGSPFAFYESPTGSPIAEELAELEEPQVFQPSSPEEAMRMSPTQGYSPGTAAEIASVRLQADALRAEFKENKKAAFKLLKRKRRGMRLVPEIEEPPDSPRRPYPSPAPKVKTPQHIDEAAVYAAAEAQYADLLSPEVVVYRDPRFEIMSPPGVVEELPKYERFDPVTALAERQKDQYDTQFETLAQATEPMFLTESPVRPEFGVDVEDEYEDQFNMMAAEGDDLFLASPELYMSPEIPYVDPFVQSVQEHEYTQSFADPERSDQRSKLLVVGRKGVKVRRHAPRPAFHDIVEVSEEPIYSGRMGAPALYAAGTPMSAITHYTPPSLGEPVRFEERAAYRPDLVTIETELYGAETPGMLDYYEHLHEPRPPLTRTRLFDGYEDSPVRAVSPPRVRMSPVAESPRRAPSPQPGYSGAVSPHARVSPRAKTPVQVFSPAISEGSPPNPFSISGFSEQFGYSPHPSPELIQEVTEEEVIYEDAPSPQVTTHYRHVSPRPISPREISPQMGVHVSPGMNLYDEMEDLYDYDYGDLEMFGGNLEPEVLDTSDIPPETEDEGDSFGWLD